MTDTGSDDGKRYKHGWRCNTRGRHVGVARVCDCGLAELLKDKTRLDRLDQAWVLVTILFRGRWFRGRWLSHKSEVLPERRDVTSPLSLREWIEALDVKEETVE